MNAISQKGHPKALIVLFLAEMWERFCYYGMRVLLILYLTKSLMKGDDEAFLIYGAYTALVYAAPVLGGRMADSLLGYRLAVILGGILMSIGEFMILGGTDSWLYVGMGTIIVGNGYFKANISSIVGRLYKDDDPRKDSGFTIFYIGINVGAFLSTLICAEVGEKFGYQYGFGLAGIGMILGVLFFVFGDDIIRMLGGTEKLSDYSAPPDPQKLHEPFVGPLSRFHVTIAGSIALIPILFVLITNSRIVGYLLFATLIYVIANFLITAFKGDVVVRDRIIVLILMMFFNVVFWACFEQAGSSLTLFADRNVDLNIFGYQMAAGTTQSFNAGFIILLGSVFSVMWIWLSRIGKNPNIPMKFGLGIIQLGLGYLIVLAGNAFVSPEYLVPLWTLVFVYLLHTTGELFLSPIGLSMVTKLAPKHMTGTAMGAWFLSFAFSNYLAAEIARFTSSGHGEGGGEVSAAESLAQYVDVYSTMGFITVGIGVLLVAISPLLKKMLHGVK